MTELTLLTYNVWGLPAWLVKAPERLDAIAQALPQSGAQFIGLQEVFSRRAQQLTTLPAFGHRAQGPQARGLTLSSGLVALSAHPITTTEQVVFERNPGFDWWARKGALLVRVEVGASVAIDVVITHLNAHGSDWDRARQLEQLIAAAERFGNESRPLVVMGDFNFEPDSLPYHQLSQALGVRDAQRDYLLRAEAFASAGDWVFTVDPRINAYQSHLGTPKRLDYIFYRPSARGVMSRLRCVGYGHHYNRPGEFHSDHFAVSARLSWAADA